MDKSTDKRPLAKRGKPRPLSRDEVLRLLRQGMSTREIAQATGATTGAVRAHLRRLEQDGVLRDGKPVGEKLVDEKEEKEEKVEEKPVGERPTEERVASDAAGRPAPETPTVPNMPGMPESLRGMDVDQLADFIIYVMGRARVASALEKRVRELEALLEEHKAYRSRTQEAVETARREMREKDERRRRFEEAKW